MCGICGGITQPNPNIIKSLMIANERRGDKSSGIAYRVGEKVSIYKDVVKSSEFVKKISSETINNSNLVICHTRMPSVGTLSKKNAHPFRYNAVVGVHNGTITNHDDIKHSGEVDSQAIFHLLSTKKNKFTEVFPELSGSMAVAWVYDGDNNLYLMRHISPLSYAIVDKTLYFNSESLVLQSTLQAAGIETEIIEVEEDVVYTVTPSLDITKTKIYLKTQASYYNSNPSGLIYPEKKENYGLVPEYSFPPQLPPGTIQGGVNNTIKENDRSLDYLKNRKGTKAPLAIIRSNPNEFWSMKQILQSYKLFKPDGSVNKKVMKKVARKPLISLLGNEGYAMIKDLKDSESFARAMMAGFGCNVCHFMSHHGFWFNKDNGFVYCNICATNNFWIKNHSVYLQVK